MKIEYLSDGVYADGVELVPTVDDKALYSTTYTIAGEIKVPVGDTDFIIPFVIPVQSGKSVKIKKVYYKINSGTSVTIDITKNGSGISGYTSLSVTGTIGSTTQDATLADGDLIAVVVTAVDGTPKNMMVSIIYEA